MKKRKYSSSVANQFNKGDKSIVDVLEQSLKYHEGEWNRLRLEAAPHSKKCNEIAEKIVLERSGVKIGDKATIKEGTLEVESVNIKLGYEDETRSGELLIEAQFIVAVYDKKGKFIAKKPMLFMQAVEIFKTKQNEILKIVS